MLSAAKPDAFFIEENRLIMIAANKLFERGITVNEATVTDRLKRDGKYGTGEHEVSFTYLESVASIPVSDVSANAEIVGQLSARRKLLTLYRETAQKLEDGVVDASEAVSDVVNKSFASALSTGKKSLHISEVDDKLDEHFKLLKENKVLAFNLGFPKLDAAIGGVRFADMIGVMAAPGQAKSLFCVSALINLAKQGLAGVKYTLEMKDDQEELRMISMSSTNLPLSDIRGGTGSTPLTEEQWSELSEIRKWVRTLPIWIDYTKNDLWSILADAKERVSANGVKVVVIDYAQKIQLQNVANEVAAINLVSSTCRQFALDNDIIVILVIRMDKMGALSALKDQEITGAEGYGSSQLLSDCTSMIHTRVNKAMPVCNCIYDINYENPYHPSSDHIFYLDEKTLRRVSKHKSIESKVCTDCESKLFKDKNRLGFIDLLKSRDGETSDRIPAMLIGPLVKFVEIEEEKI